MINVIDVERREQISTINHAFEPPTPPFDDEGQTFLDPLNPQSASSAALLDRFVEMMANDPAYGERLEHHYTMWKRVVDDATHPAQATLRDRIPGSNVLRRAEPVRRAGPKIGANDPCPCGSDRKYKRCCRMTEP